MKILIKSNILVLLIFILDYKYKKNKNDVYRVNYDWTDGERLRFRLKMKRYS